MTPAMRAIEIIKRLLKKPDGTIVHKADFEFVLGHISAAMQDNTRQMRALVEGQMEFGRELIEMLEEGE